MKYETLIAAKPGLLATAGESWKKLAEEFEDIIGDFKTKVWNQLDEDEVWQGDASDIASSHAKKMHTKMKDYLDDLTPAAKDLVAAGEDLQTYQKQLKSLVDEIKDTEPRGKWSVADDGTITGPEGQEGKINEYDNEMTNILNKADSADREGAAAAKKADVKYKFLKDVLSEERGEERKTAKKAAELATKSSDELSFAEGKKLHRLLKEHGEDPAFAGAFLNHVSPKEMLNMEVNLHPGGDGFDWGPHTKGEGLDSSDLRESLQRELGEVLAAGTSREGSEYLGGGSDGGEDSIIGSGQEGEKYGEKLMKSAGEMDDGYRSVGLLLHSGQYSAPFINTVGDALIEADKSGDLPETNISTPDNNYVDNRGKGDDPMVGLMTAMEHSPGAADGFFDPQRNPDTISYLLDRDWPVEKADVSSSPRMDVEPVGGENLGERVLGKALESATIGGDYHTPESARVMSETVHQLATSDGAYTDDGAVPAPLRESVGKMVSGYMGDVQAASGENSFNADHYDLDGDDPNWASSRDGIGHANFGRHELYRVMGSAAYDPNAYADMRDANTVYTADRLEHIANTDAPLDDQRSDMLTEARKGAMVFGNLDNARSYAIDEFYDGEDAKFNSAIDAGGHLSAWAVQGGGALIGGGAGAIAGGAGADAIEQGVDALRQDSSNIVTEETSDLYAKRGDDAQRLLNEKLWEHRMWNDGQPPPIDWAQDGDDEARNVGQLDNGEFDRYKRWIDNDPYSVDQGRLEDSYNNGKTTYDEATGKTKLDYGDTTE